MKIVWMPEAEEDLRSLYDYIAQDSPQSAAKVSLSVFNFVVSQLETFPQNGRTGHVQGTYEILVPKLPYWIPYRVNEDTIEILRVYHTSRQWPENFS